MRLDAPRLRLIALLLTIAAIVVVLILVLGGGDESPDEAARTTAGEFVAAITEGEYETACEMMTPALRDQFGGEGCPDRLGDTAGLPEEVEIEILGVRVSGPKAAADVEVRVDGAPPEDRTFGLETANGEEWQVSSPLE